MTHPLTARQVKDLLQVIMAGGGTVVFTRHALQRMAQRKRNQDEVFAVLRGGWMYDAPEQAADGAWRYKLELSSIGAAAVIEFETQTETVVVTVW